MVWAVPTPVIATTVASLCGFLTAVAGFWLNARLTWKRQQEATALQVANVRTLIACEIDHNLHALKTYLDALNSLATLAQPYEGTILIDPRYSQDAYKSQLSAMPLALGTEEIREVFKFYSELESLTGDSHPEWEPAFETEGGKHQTAQKRLLWRRYIESASNRLSQGNPLKINS